MLTPPEQFGIIEKGVYRSDMLHPSHFSFIKALQLKTALVLSPEVPTRAVLNFLEENNIKLVHLGLSIWKPNLGWRPVSEELIKDGLEMALDVGNHPILVLCTSGIHETGTFVGCLRKLQNWNFSSIVAEYRSYAGNKVRYVNEQFIEEVWEQYKKQRDGDHFTDNASFVFVPTASGARGYDAVRQFLSTAYDSRIISVKEKVIIQTIGENSVVEESETTINFISGDGAWLVPGVDSRYTIENQVVIPTITSASFEGDRISSIRVYWDQASALKQLRLISDKNSWPIVSDRQVDAIRDISSAHLNPFGKTDHLSAGIGKMNLNQPAGRRPVHTSSRVNQPGGTGGKSTIFDDMRSDAHEDIVQRGKRHTSRVNQPGGTGGKTSSLFGDSDTTSEDNTNRRFNSNKNVSQFSIGGDDDSQHDTSSITGSSRRRGKSQIESSVELGDDGGNPPPQRSSVKPSSRILRPPGGGGSQFTFG
ncbi:21295_t:CDS:10 [Rhizophagus irregularis]|nr:21295_t:CDS:10 [Rhizophagus irregularis]